MFITVLAEEMAPVIRAEMKKRGWLVSESVELPTIVFEQKRGHANGYCSFVPPKIAICSDTNVYKILAHELCHWYDLELRFRPWEVMSIEECGWVKWAKQPHEARAREIENYMEKYNAETETHEAFQERGSEVSA